MEAWCEERPFTAEQLAANLNDQGHTWVTLEVEGEGTTVVRVHPGVSPTQDMFAQVAYNKRCRFDPDDPFEFHDPAQHFYPPTVEATSEGLKLIFRKK